MPKVLTKEKKNEYLKLSEDTNPILPLIHGNKAEKGS